MNQEERRKKVEDFRGAYLARVMILTSDIISVIFSYLFVLWLRYDAVYSNIEPKYLVWYWQYLPVNLIVTIGLLAAFHMYSSIWRFAGVTEMARTALAGFLTGLIHIIVTVAIGHRMPISYYVFGWLTMEVMIIGVRVSSRIYHSISDTRAKKNGINVMVIGAGESGRVIIQEMLRSDKTDLVPVCVIDDSPSNRGKVISGVPIVGFRNDIPEAAKKYGVKQIIFAIPSADPKDRAEILNICKETGCDLKMIPGIYQMVNGEVSLSKIRPVSVEDLLGRDQVKVNNDEVFQMLYGKTILVTGGGGSIGSELCRQIAKHHPKQLILFDIYENTLYDIQQELKFHDPDLNLVALVGDMTDRGRVRDILETYHPDLIYHAAAHKHVPLMEESPNEAIKNNVFGTLILTEEAARAHVERFLLISTDKAVNPTNIMGASKRLCEMIIQMSSRKYPSTVFMAVRFGNVLGSNGSVIPLFKKQIEAGGPVTVTDKNIIRYFMTIPEAVSLVLQASYYARGGEIFILDMGEPVRIDDMARNLIRLSGLTPDVDIKIVYTGLRPGEKLYEELLMDEEGMTKTRNDLIYIGHPIPMNDNVFEKQLVKLNTLCHSESQNIEEYVKEMVVTYHPYHTETAQ